MRPPSDRRTGRRFSRIVHLALATCAFGLASCGTLAAPSSGDMDLAASYVGPYQLITTPQTPRGSVVLIRADVSGALLDEPSIVRPTPDARRIAFVTMSVRGQPDVIARAAERMDLPAGSLSFDGAAPLFHAEQPWEGSYVRSPDVRAIDATHFVMAYAAEGGIGVATSSDGMAFAHPTSAAIGADVLDGGSGNPVEPSIARDPLGEWYMAYRRGTSIYLAHTSDVNGAWSQNATPILVPEPDPGADSGVIDTVSLADPALSILTTPAGRSLYVIFYTASSSSPRTVIAAAASFDRVTWTKLGRVVYADRTNNVRAGSLDVVDPRTAFLWVGLGAPDARTITLLIGPASVPRVSAPGM